MYDTYWELISDIFEISLFRKKIQNTVLGSFSHYVYKCVRITWTLLSVGKQEKFWVVSDPPAWRCVPRSSRCACRSWRQRSGEAFCLAQPSYLGRLRSRVTLAVFLTRHFPRFGAVVMVVLAGESPDNVWHLARSSIRPVKIFWSKCPKRPKRPCVLRIWNLTQTELPAL